MEEIGVHLNSSTFNTFGVVEWLGLCYHQFHRWLFILKSFGFPPLVTDRFEYHTSEDIPVLCTLWNMKDGGSYKDFAALPLDGNEDSYQ